MLEIKDVISEAIPC